MLRVTVHDDSQFLTFQLEGSLADDWVRELDECWRRASTKASGRVVRFDLTQATHVDAAGKAFLAARHRQGAELIARDCLMKAIVAEISNARIPDDGCPSTKIPSNQMSV